MEPIRIPLSLHQQRRVRAVEQEITAHAQAVAIAEARKNEIATTIIAGQYDPAELVSRGYTLAFDGDAIQCTPPGVPETPPPMPPIDGEGAEA